MEIRSKSLINKKYYELSGQLSLLGRDNLDFKSINLAQRQRFTCLCKTFKLKRIILQKKYSYLI